jgi:hypothetical protein
MVRNRKPPLQPASPGKHGGSHCGGPLAQPARPCTLIGLMGLLNQECNVSGTALTKIEYLVYFMHLYRQDNGWAGALFTRAIRLRLNKKTSALLRSLALISRLNHFVKKLLKASKVSNHDGFYHVVVNDSCQSDDIA